MDRFPDTDAARHAVTTMRMMVFATSVAVRSSLSTGQVERRLELVNEPAPARD